MSLGGLGTTRAAGSRRDEARARVDALGLGPAAVEGVVRSAMSRVPPSLLDRARVLLRRFFSAAPWSFEDDSALAAIVGPGRGRQEIPLGDGLTVVVAFRADSLRLDVTFDDSDDDAPGASGADTPTSPTGIGSGATAGTDDPIVATFARPVVPEAGPTPRIVRFLTGPGTGAGAGSGWARDADATRDDRVARLLRTFVDITGVLLGSGFVAVELGDDDRWDDLLVPVLETVTEAFGREQVPVAEDRRVERARMEFAGVNPDSAKGIGRVRDALTSPDAGVRQIAVELVAYDDPFSSEKAWRIALDDASRAVRRAAIVAMAAAQREELRPLLERGLGESDSCARYHAVLGLGRIGVERSRGPLERMLADSDARVRHAARRVLRPR